MYYEHISSSGNNHTYRIVLKVYRDCAPPNQGQNDPSINVSIFSGGGAFLRNQAIPMISTTNLSKTSFSECVNPRPEVCYVVMEYRGEVVLAESAAGYTLAFQRCCRVEGIVNITPPTNVNGNTYTLTIPGTQALATAPDNSSPVFSMNDTLLVCYNSSIELDYGATDPDGDSLDFYFTPAISGASENDPSPGTATSPPYRSLSYRPGFSASNPLGTDISIDRRTGIITGRSPATTGEYVVSVGIDEFRDGVKIATTRKELHVNVANCTIAAAELPIRIMSCDGYTVQLENQSASPAIRSYYWEFGVPGAPGNTSTDPRPTFTYADTGVYIAKLVVNRESQCADSTTTEVAVFPGFTADFEAQGACFLNPFNFVDRTTARYGNVAAWQWSFNDPDDPAAGSTVQNPSHTYPRSGISPTVTLISTSSKGCKDTVSLPVAVTDKPYVVLPFRDTLICSIDSLQLNATASGGTFSWGPLTNILNPNTANPVVFPKQTTDYVVTVSQDGCVGTDTVRVNVIDQVTINAGADTSICRTDSITLNPNTQGLAFQWEPAGLFDDPTIRNPRLSPVDSITLVQVTTSVGRCRATDEMRIITAPYAQVDAGMDTVICFGDSAFLRGSSNASSVTWSPAAFVENTGSLHTIATPIEPTVFTLTANGIAGCPKPVQDTVLVFVRPEIELFAGNDTTVVFGQTLQFNAIHTGTGITWSPGIGLSDPNIANPVGTYSEEMLPFGVDTIRYYVQAFTPEGCSAEDDILLRLFNSNPTVFIPSAFTPNGDGLNDIIKPIAVGISEFEFFRIYNRFGQLVFETADVQRGWDGRINGQMQQTGAYVYFVKAKDFSGNDLILRGTITLIR